MLEPLLIIDATNVFILFCRDEGHGLQQSVPGQRLDDDEFDAILKEADLDGDRHIDYQEFLQVGPHSAFPFVVSPMAHLL